MGACYTDSVYLGAFGYATPDVERADARLTPPGEPATRLSLGGGLLGVTVTADTERANLGDAELFIHTILTTLATAAPETLVLIDGYGNTVAFGDAVCVGARGVTFARCFARIELDFLAPEQSTDATPPSNPGAPATYAGTSTDQSYTAGGTAIGHQGERMDIEMERSFPLRGIPRCRGVRARGPSSAALLRLSVRAHALDRTQHVAEYLRDLERSIGASELALAGNGNSFSGCLLESIRPEHRVPRARPFSAVFTQEIA